MGFVAERGLLYDFERHDPKHFLNDLELFASRRLNRHHAVMLDNKLLFEIALRDRIPTTNSLAIIRDGRLCALDPDNPVRTIPDLIARAREHGALIVKPVGGYGGKGVALVDADTDPRELARMVATRHEHLVQARLEQYGLQRELFPATLNTTRVFTYRDPDDDQPFIAAAVQRIGRARSVPVDNISSGGLFAPIALDSGVLGAALEYPLGPDRVRPTEVHPDSGVRIEGAQLTSWSEIARLALEGLRAAPGLVQVGWDFALTPSGPIALEGNNIPDVALIQAFQPVLRDPRMRRFYLAHGVVGER